MELLHVRARGWGTSPQLPPGTGHLLFWHLHLPRALMGWVSDPRLTLPTAMGAGRLNLAGVPTCHTAFLGKPLRVSQTTVLLGKHALSQSTPSPWFPPGFR